MISGSVDRQDRGLLLGDGLFETLLALQGGLADEAAHLDRMAQGCEVLGLPPLDRVKARTRLAGALISLNGQRGAVRLTLTAGPGGRGLDRPNPVRPRLFASATLLPRTEGPARLALSRVRRNADSPTSRLKSLSYLDSVLARAEARGQGADEALMLNTRGELACAAAANLFWVKAGVLFTPALDCGVLSGIMRRRAIFAAAEIGVITQEVHARLEDLNGAEGCFLTNSLIGVRPALISGSAHTPHPLVARLADILN